MLDRIEDRIMPMKYDCSPLTHDNMYTMRADKSLSAALSAGGRLPICWLIFVPAVLPPGSCLSVIKKKKLISFYVACRCSIGHHGYFPCRCLSRVIGKQFGVYSGRGKADREMIDICEVLCYMIRNCLKRVAHTKDFDSGLQIMLVREQF